MSEEVKREVQTWDPVEWFCKKVLGTKFYIRYMDDVIILSQSKEELHEIKERISKFLDEELQLALNKKTSRSCRYCNRGLRKSGLLRRDRR